MRIRIEQFDFIREKGGIRVSQLGKAKALARIIPDPVHPGMWRVVSKEGWQSGMVNITRAKDLAFGLAETAVYLNEAA